MAPIDEISSLSNSGVQFCPASVVFQTPPATPPKYQVFGSPGTPSIARARPPRNGPTCRHCIPLKSFSSIAPGGSGFFSGETAGVGLLPPPCLLGTAVGSTAFPDSEIDKAKIKNRHRPNNGLSIRVV